MSFSPPASEKSGSLHAFVDRASQKAVRGYWPGPDAGDGARAAGAAGKGSGKGGAGTGAGRGSSAGGKGVANYQGRLVAWMNRYKRYPDRARRLRQEGTVRVSFTIDRNGRLLSRRIVGGYGSPSGSGGSGHA